MKRRYIDTSQCLTEVIIIEDKDSSSCCFFGSCRSSEGEESDANEQEERVHDHGEGLDDRFP